MVERLNWAALVEYEGTAEFSFTQPDGSIVHSGDFRLAQYESGNLTLGFTVKNSVVQGKIELRRDGRAPVFSGHDSRGWKLSTSGQLLGHVPLRMLLMNSGTGELVLRPQYVTARSGGMDVTGYNRVRFVVSNLLWDDRIGETLPDPLNITVEGFKVSITPIDDYLARATRIRQTRGVGATAQIAIETTDCSRRSLHEFATVTDQLNLALCLVTRNRINWYFGDALAESGDAVERIYKHAVTTRFSNFGNFPDVLEHMDLAQLVASFLHPEGTTSDVSMLTARINQYVSACDEGLYLQERGLFASTLVELIVSSFAKSTNNSNFIPRGQYKRQVLKRIEKVLPSTDLSQEQQDHVRESLANGFRRTFRERLYLFAESLNVPLAAETMKRVVVHEVRN